MSIDEQSLGTHPRSIIERSELFRNLPYRQNLAAISNRFERTKNRLLSCNPPSARDDALPYLRRRVRRPAPAALRPAAPGVMAHGAGGFAAAAAAGHHRRRRRRDGRRRRRQAGPPPPHMAPWRRDAPLAVAHGAMTLVSWRRRRPLCHRRASDGRRQRASPAACPCPCPCP